MIQAAEENPKAVMPGYTHMQKAQPVLFAHHMLAYSWMFEHDFKRLSSARDAANELVLGNAALAGTTYPLDRGAVAAELGFSRVSENSLDAVSNRDYLLDLEYACAVGMMHLSRMAEELVLWSSDEFGFLTMDDTWTTGSSIMPQKNPYFAELVRGKSGWSFGDLMAATDLADYLVGKGMALQQGRARCARARRQRPSRLCGPSTKTTMAMIPVPTTVLQARPSRKTPGTEALLEPKPRVGAA